MVTTKQGEPLSCNELLREIGFRNPNVHSRRVYRCHPGLARGRYSALALSSSDAKTRLHNYQTQGHRYVQRRPSPTTQPHCNQQTVL